MVDPSRRYQGSLVVKPMWANWVPASIGTGVPSPHRSATSMRVIAASWRLVNVAPAGQPGRARREHHHDRPVGVGRAARAGARPAPSDDEPLDLVGRRDDDGRVDDVEAGPPLAARSAGG